MTVVRTGIDRVVRGEIDLTGAGRIGLVTNRAARTTWGQWTGDALSAAGCRIALILTPEHGLDALAGAGVPIAHDQLDTLPVLSLYGAEDAAVEKAMTDIDALLVDLPDVGCRYYTYPWTIRRVLALAARHGLPVTLLDRPNPLSGTVIEGNLPVASLRSAVCASWIPVRHGLTNGELARWNRRYFGLEVELTVVRVTGWMRDMRWEQLGLPWVAPSPALVSIEAVRAYPGTCLFEGTNISEGRGTDQPFQLIGAPFLDGSEFAARLSDDESLVGARVVSIDFTPTTSKWVGEQCHGVTITIEDPDRFQPVQAGLALLAGLCMEAKFKFRDAHFDALAGTPEWRLKLEGGASAAQITTGWSADEHLFRHRRAEILLYE